MIVATTDGLDTYSGQENSSRITLPTSKIARELPEVEDVMKGRRVQRSVMTGMYELS